MSAFAIIALILLIGFVGWLAGAHRASQLVRKEEGAAPKLHSRSVYHGAFVFSLAVVPALIVLFVGLAVAPAYVASSVRSSFPTEALDANGAVSPLSYELVSQLGRNLRLLSAEEQAAAHSMSLGDLQPIFQRRGIPIAQGIQPYMLPIALRADDLQNSLWLGIAAISLAIAVAGAFFGLSRIAVRFRARNRVEGIVRGALILCSMIAILTTIGIILSMLFETIDFFGRVSPSSFFFGTVWDPRFAAAGSGGAQGQFGLIPLLAGTIYIAAVAMLFAVPTGLLSAIYMAEYADRRVRSVVKPLLEVLAGIPTIVYGFFALITVGPFLRDISAEISGLATGNYVPFIQAQSILTAGLVMGVMLIPFVSSLSDDVITAVPRSLRDGSLGLGATQSETIKKVVLPAALPGIVSAILLTASRAIGETMIVVLAAGVAARLTINPLEAMTTVTVKIVNQLTGDLEFNSPQTLVAFALGITLFAITLLLNIVALYIVRKYREQYE
ncbi:phosphate ABC transporter permease subunit PstC [Aureimonas psammosilenae]|uniref:phosphate ABC transporter permease subunit PstC n=1 Tax=Aureimonas psammosilenae TaxID=2495496 RepID=UPI001260AC1F|nr:phosphate ABC transporter permease subunit PstC [Aureimonas psammosilenae]